MAHADISADNEIVEEMRQQRRDLQAALSVGDYSSALSKLEQLEANLALTPDMTRQASGFEFDRSALDRLRKHITQRLGSTLTAGGVRRQQFEPVRPEGIEWDE